MEYLTADNIQYAMIVATWVVYLLRKLAQATQTKTDDDILKVIDEGYFWVHENWETAYKQVEELSKISKLTPVQKTFQYMKLLNDAWVKAQGKKTAIPKVAEIIANANAKTQAITDKLNLLKDEIQYKLFGGASPTSEATEEPIKPIL